MINITSIVSPTLIMNSYKVVITFIDGIERTFVKDNGRICLKETKTFMNNAQCVIDKINTYLNRDDIYSVSFHDRSDAIIAQYLLGAPEIDSYVYWFAHQMSAMTSKKRKLFV
jgi:hypothetical protein